MQTPNDTNAGGCTCVGEFYYKRWGIEKAFNRPKHRLVQDVAAKILRDNLRSLVSMTAHADADLSKNIRINHAYAHTALKPLMPILLLGEKIGRKLGTLLRGLLRLIAGKTYRHRDNRSKPSKPGAKPHKKMT
ncbi:hypothetical protein [Massilia psychrophila]|uniref:hypothetical protein n=1 Tax=Massilia psychrophila TaxID=1603353 RepID=UPI0019A0CF5C|nr:hypothetical protein [Massilia psychrophila]GGE85485.1 hypothetical protein GCM10008020_32870 [Massilia psychrophila]